MNINRKIQLSAAAVIATGALGLSLLSPDPARAATCGLKSVCLHGLGAICPLPPNIVAATCNGIAPPGCTWTGGSTCHNFVSGCFDGPYLTCFYH